jgi:hypothetical protein
MLVTFSNTEYLLSHIATGTVEVRLRIAQPLGVFETTKCKVQYQKQKKKNSPGGSIRVSLQWIDGGFFIVTSKKNILD